MAAKPRPRPRVLQIMAGAARGGAERYFLRACLALHEAGVPQCVVTRPEPARLAALDAAGIEWVPARFGGRLDWRTRAVVRRAAASFRPRIVMCTMSRAARFCPRGPTGDFVTVGRLGGYYDLKYFRGLDHLVCNTPDLVDYVVGAGWPRGRAHLLENFVTAAPAEPTARASLDTPADATLVLALGRLHPNKGFDTLLEALALVPGAYLWLAGQGPREAALKAQAAGLGIAARVRFLGWLDDPAPAFAAADIFVIPSRHEPLGNTLIEAWAHGVPVVAAASQGPAHLIVDGATGLLAPVDDPGAMAGAIGRLIADPGLGARLARAGRKAYERGHTKERSVARHLALFEAFLGAHGRDALSQ